MDESRHVTAILLFRNQKFENSAFCGQYIALKGLGIQIVDPKKMNATRAGNSGSSPIGQNEVGLTDERTIWGDKDRFWLHQFVPYLCFRERMNRWFLRFLAVSSLAIVGWSSFSAPTMKTTPVNVMASSVAAAEAVSRFAPSQALELQKGLSFAAE